MLKWEIKTVLRNRVDLNSGESAAQDRNSTFGKTVVSSEQRQNSPDEVEGIGKFSQGIQPGHSAVV